MRAISFFNQKIAFWCTNSQILRYKEKIVYYSKMYFLSYFVAREVIDLPNSGAQYCVYKIGSDLRI